MSSDLELQDRLEAVYLAQTEASYWDTGSDVASLRECRELLQLFVRLGNGDLRDAVLRLLRTMAGPSH